LNILRNLIGPTNLEEKEKYDKIYLKKQTNFVGYDIPSLTYKIYVIKI